VEYLTTTILQIQCRVSQWKNFENRQSFCEVMDKTTVGPFFDSCCINTEKTFYITCILFAMHLWVISISISAPVNGGGVI